MRIRPIDCYARADFAIPRGLKLTIIRDIYRSSGVSGEVWQKTQRNNTPPRQRVMENIWEWMRDEKD